jgi:uroporphyrinogen decarboxylase
MTMNKIERVAAALRGETVDQVPISFWGHSYLKEWSPAGLADAMLENYTAYGWDYMKVNPRASYHVEDWGVRLERPTAPDKGPRITKRAVTEPADWRRIRPLEPHAGVLGEQLDALAQIRDGLKGGAYFVQTIFSPLSVAKYLAGNDPAPVRTSMADDPGALRAALDVIVETFTAYAQACLETGASGIFFATTGWASADVLTEDEYRRWGVEYDLAVVESFAGKAPFNILHNCGQNIYFRALADYPVEAISWASTAAGNPSLAEGRDLSGKAVMGGVDVGVLAEGTPGAVAGQVREAVTQTEGRHVLVAPGCSIKPTTPAVNLAAAAAAVRVVGAA